MFLILMKSKFELIQNIMGTSHTHNHSHDSQNKQQKRHDSKHNHPISTYSIPSPLNPQTKLMKDSIFLPQFGGEVAVDKINKVFIKKIQVFQFEQQFVESVIKKRMLLKHPNFITVNNYNFQSLKDNQTFDSRTDLQKSLYFCYPQSKILRLQFSPAIMNVNGLIKSYCQRRQPLQQHQVRRIIRQVVQCLIYLKQNNAFHGDIKPSTIFIHPKTQAVQLVDSFLVHNGRTGYQIVNQNPRSESFLTPEQLQRKKKKSTDSLEKIYQSQVFCLGLTLIEMMTFEASMEAYNLEDLQIKRQFVERKFFQMRQYGYSFQLADLALRCIHKEPSKRPTFEQILQTLSMNNQPFTF